MATRKTPRGALQGALALAAFEGWNDAGNAASDALAYLVEEWHATALVELDPEDYHDFQVTRPRLRMTENDGLTLDWPGTRVFTATTPAGRDVVLIHGVEPSMRWRHFCAEILRLLGNCRVGTFITMGALLADVPHTRPIPVSLTSSFPELRERLMIEMNTYEGPSGILGVLEQAARSIHLPTAAMWAAVPHYVANPPSPKAVLALLRSVEEIIGEPIPMRQLNDEAWAWQEGVDNLAATDHEISEYVGHLESTQDASLSPDASGEAIAREFERYLEHRGGGPETPWS